MAERNLQFEAAIIINDLASMVMRIEMLQAHPRYTDALNAVQAAKTAMTDGSIDLHQRAMRERFAAMDRGLS
jgi:predicted aspartyl protease